MNMEKIREKAATWMLNRGWKKLTAKRREGVYPEHSRRVYPERSRRIYPEPGRREQSLFEHTMVELDTLLSLLPVLRQPNHFSLNEEEEKILIAHLLHMMQENKNRRGRSEKNGE